MRHLLLTVPLWLTIVGCPTPNDECATTDGGCCEVFTQDDPCFKACGCEPYGPTKTDQDSGST